MLNKIKIIMELIEYAVTTNTNDLLMLTTS